MHKPLIILAQIEAKPESVDLMKAELTKLIEPTRKENGCLQYDLHQDNEKPEFFVFYEVWENRELWQVHMKNENLAAFAKNTEGAIKTFTLNEMKQVD